jgi:hypothetical protein
MFFNKDERRRTTRPHANIEDVVTHYNDIASSPDNDLVVINKNAKIEDIHKAFEKLSPADQETFYNKFKGNRKEDQFSILELEDRRLRNYLIKTFVTVALVTTAAIVVLFAYAFIKATDKSDLIAVTKDVVETVSEIVKVILDPPDK